MPNDKEKLSEAEKSAILASARLAYLDPTGQEFWAELTERIAIREGQNGELGQTEPPPVEPLPRRE